MVSQLFLRFYTCWLSGERSCPLDYLFYEDQSVSKILLVHAYQNYPQKLKSSSRTILVLTYIEENDHSSFFFRKYRITSIQALPAYADNSYRNPNRTLYNYISVGQYPITQLVDSRTLDRKVAGSNFAWAAMLCP